MQRHSALPPLLPLQVHTGMADQEEEVPLVQAEDEGDCSQM
jgi:hypothetical protein